MNKLYKLDCKSNHLLNTSINKYFVLIILYVETS